jgi:hypothetical protein
MKPALLLFALLLFATSAHAQRSHSPAAGGGNSSGLGNNWGYWGSGWGPGSFGFASRPVRYEAPRSYSVEYARNDGPFVPSTYMNYNDALALGQQQLAAADKSTQVDESRPLGDVARAYKARRVPTLRLQSRALQDSTGRLVLCNLNGNDCHRP